MGPEGSSPYLEHRKLSLPTRRRGFLVCISARPAILPTPVVLTTLRLRVLVVLSVLLGACGAERVSQPEVTSYLSGTLVVADTLAATTRPEQFSIVVFTGSAAGTDTLGSAPVRADGTFALTVTAADAGVYPLVLLYEKQPIKLDELVVADGDSATVRFAFPVTSRPLRIRSRENDAWTAYRNARALYESTLREAVGQPDALARLGNATAQASNILWSLREGYPGTVAEALGAAESIVMLDGWDDSLMVARAQEIAPENPGFVTVAQAARRGQARLAGQGASIRLLESFRDRADVDDAAALQAEIVTARLDSLQGDAAVAEARKLRERYPKSEWAAWAERASYEAETLLPGKKAPAFAARTDRGRTVALDSLRGRVVVLEFFSPASEAFRQQLDMRLALEQALADEPFTFVSVSVDADSLLSRAFFSQTPITGARVVASGGLEGELARQYNVHMLPTRYLIAPDGTILAKYVGPLVPQLAQDVLTLLGLTPAS